MINLLANMENAHPVFKVLALSVLFFLALPFLGPILGTIGVLIYLALGVIIGTLVIFGDDIVVGIIIGSIILTLLFFGICVLLRIRRNKKILKQMQTVQNVKVPNVKQSKRGGGKK